MRVDTSRSSSDGASSIGVARLDGRDLAVVHVDRDDLAALLGEGDRDGQADVAQADDPIVVMRPRRSRPAGECGRSTHCHLPPAVAVSALARPSARDFEALDSASKSGVDGACCFL
jgi:hypothetical protein